MARILILSDIHYDQGTHPNLYGSKILENSDFKNSIDIDSTINLLENAIKAERPFDLIVFCGDCIDGRATKESIDDFKALLDRLMQTGCINTQRGSSEPREHLLIVPGNHDVDRNNEQPLRDFKTHFDAYLTPYKEKMPSGMSRYAPTYLFPDIKVAISCISTAENGATVDTEATRLIAELSKEPKSDLNEEIKTFLEKYRSFDIPTVIVEHQNRFLDSAKDLEKNGEDNGFLKIIISHHPLFAGIEDSLSIKHFSETIGGFHLMETAQRYGYRLFIHGHLHKCSSVEFKHIFPHSHDPIIQIGVPNLNLDEDVPSAVLIETSEDEQYPTSYRAYALGLDKFRKAFRKTQELVNVSDVRQGQNQPSRILVDRDIVRLIGDEEGKVIHYGNIDSIEAASYDCSLSPQYKRAPGNERYCSWDDQNLLEFRSEDEQHNKRETKDNQSHKEDDNYIVIEPGETLLLYTKEEFDVPKNIVMHASPISSWLKKGLQVEMSFFVDPGFKGPFSFPVTNMSAEPQKIKATDHILSIEIVELGTSAETDWTELRSREKQPLSDPQQ